MNYDIKIINNQDGSGRLELDRLSFLVKQLKAISKRSLLIQLFGSSKITLPRKYHKYLKVYLSGQSSDGKATSFTLDADNFGKLAVQLDVFRDISLVKGQTPVSLIISAFRAALSEGEDKNLLDEALMSELMKLRKFFKSDSETILLSNRGTVPQVSVSAKEFDQIEHLYNSIPQAEKVVVNGVIDELKFSGKQMVLLTESKARVIIVCEDSSVMTEVSVFFGKEITLYGMAHYKPGGQLSYILLERFAQPGKGDRFFSRKPDKSSLQQNIALQLRDGKKANPLDDVIGKWPGDETDQEFELMLKELE